MAWLLPGSRVGPVPAGFIILTQTVLLINTSTACGILFLKLLRGKPLISKGRVGVII